MRGAIERLASLELTDDELRRVLDSELAWGACQQRQGEGWRKGKHMTDSIIETNQLTKSPSTRASRKALRRSRTCARRGGSIFGFLASAQWRAARRPPVKTPDGARCESDSGSARVFGIRVTDAETAPMKSAAGSASLPTDKEILPASLCRTNHHASLVRSSPNGATIWKRRYLQMFELPPQTQDSGDAFQGKYAVEADAAGWRSRAELIAPVT